MFQLTRERNSISQNGGVTVPTWLFAGFIGVIIGGIFTPSIMAMTEAGSRKLAELSRQYIEKKR